MSKINQALTELARQSASAPSTIQPANIPPVRQRPVLPWLLGGFALSMAVGGWSLNYQAASIAPSAALAAVNAPEVVIANPLPADYVSPTSKRTLIESELDLLPAAAAKRASPVIAQTSTSALRNTTPTVATANSHRVVTPAIVLASVAAPVDAAPSAELGQTGAPTPQQTAPAQGRVHIEQVELTPQQLAFTAQERAQKSLDSNNLSDAIDQYQEALRYTPNDEKIRQTLSALYYGKGEVRKSVDLLQQGIERNANGQELRLALAKLLIKENQPQAALTPLLYLPSGASEAYLSLRAALAQKVNQDDIAKQSYQQLVQIAPNNGRWWMGLGIQQERALQTKQAASSYQMALDKIGLSSQSQQFIRQRLAVLKQLEEQPSAN